MLKLPVRPKDERSALAVTEFVSYKLMCMVEQVFCQGIVLNPRWVKHYPADGDITRHPDIVEIEQSAEFANIVIRPLLVKNDPQTGSVHMMLSLFRLLQAKGEYTPSFEMQCMLSRIIRLTIKRLEALDNPSGVKSADASSLQDPINLVMRIPEPERSMVVRNLRMESIVHGTSKDPSDGRDSRSDDTPACGREREIGYALPDGEALVAIYEDLRLYSTTCFNAADWETVDSFSREKLRNSPFSQFIKSMRWQPPVENILLEIAIGAVKKKVYIPPWECERLKDYTIGETWVGLDVAAWFRRSFHWPPHLHKGDAKLYLTDQDVEDQDVEDEDRRVRNILCYGDSNTYGYDPSTTHRFSSDVRWTGVLNKYLGAGFHIIEEGCNGRTAVCVDPEEPWNCASHTLEACLNSHKPVDIFILMLGTNDAKCQFHATARQIADGVEDLVVRTKRFCEMKQGFAPDILLLTPPPITECIAHSPFAESFAPDVPALMAQLPDLYRQVCVRQGCVFMHTGNYVRTSDLDAIHLDAEGHAMIAMQLLKYIYSNYNKPPIK